jgi:hypothetical protein
LLTVDYWDSIECDSYQWEGYIGDEIDHRDRLDEAGIQVTKVVATDKELEWIVRNFKDVPTYSVYGPERLDQGVIWFGDVGQFLVANIDWHTSWGKNK